MFHLAAQGMGAAGADVERCSACGARPPLDDRGHCRKCVQAAVTRAAALDSFDLGVRLCLEASIDEIQLRHALILAVNGTEAALIRDFVVRRREPDGGFVWHVPSSFLDDEELTSDGPAK
jgi:hypothetical protein